MDFRDQGLAVLAREELFNIPGILRPSGIELEEDQVRRSDQWGCGIGCPWRHAGSIENLPLPRVLAHDEIQGALARFLEADHAREWIQEISFSDINCDTFVPESLPKRGLHAGGIHHEE